MGQRPSVVSGDWRIISLLTRSFFIVGALPADVMTRDGLLPAINLLPYDMT